MNEDLQMAQMSSLHGVTIDDLTPDRPAAQRVALVETTLRRITLGIILIASVFLNFFQLSRLGYGNAYYAAGVKSMLMSWHNFFFASFDPGGFVTIDKPPLGFWLQAGSAEVFGFHGWSLVLPEALAGVGSVVLIYHLVRRVFGELAGLAAAGIMAVTPVAVATNRSNIVDSLLVFTILLGAWAVFRATETARLRWLMLAMALVGLGFNIKSLEAYLAFPAFIAVYFLGAKLPWRTKIWQLALGGVVLLAVSLSWATAVDLTPVSQRPYVGSSDNNSEFNLIFGYNGLNRLLSGNWSFLGLHGRGFGRGPARSAPPPATRTTGARFGFGAGENGASGPLRLINQQLGGQSGWLLPLALIGILAAGWQIRPRLPLGDRHRSVLFWGVWLLAGAGFFSIAGFFHSYYLVMMAPPIAALGGIGLSAMWHDYRSASWRGWLLPFALIAVALIQRHILSYYTSWHPWVATLVTVLAVGAAVVLLLLRLVKRGIAKRTEGSLVPLATRGGMLALALGMLAIGLVPTAWATDTTLHGAGGLLPTAGPSARGGFGGRGGFPLGARSGFEIPGLPNTGGLGGFGGVDPLTLQYLLNNQGNSRYLVATLNAMSAAPIILETGKPVMALGGFTGSDPILTVADLQKLIADGTIRFFMLEGGFGANRGFVRPNTTSGSNTGGFSFDGTPGNGQFGSRSTGEPGADRFQEGRVGEPGAFGSPGGGAAGFSGAPGGVGSAGSLTQWVTSNCTPVSPSAINGTQNSIGRGTSLYDCRP